MLTRSRRPGRLTRRLGGLAAVLTLGLGGLTAAGAGAQAATNPFERGPAPTTQSISANRGPFATAEVGVGLHTGFGGGRIYYPTDTSKGTFGAVVICPGFTATWSTMNWLGPRIASQGFVVIGIDTNTLLDLPGQRSAQQFAALDHLLKDQRVADRIDKNRLAVSGWSMGGGGTLESAATNKNFKAAVAFAPWDTRTFTTVKVPSLIIGGQADVIAPVGVHSLPFYNSIPRGTPKVYLELTAQSHFFTNGPNTRQAAATISWLKRFVDDDTRYSPFICPGPRGADISSYKATCPI